ncbi:unnamed protein product [Effrenium voratum]|uniref:Uncharacterized protein n=1 Tax=Effrenium voratum TaxID=2562239 RepID=A0AA36I6W6_9DINO|nr:unnamed protein product [Effrenium voratum]
MAARASCAASRSGWPLPAASADAAGQMLSEFTEFTLARVLWSVASCPVDADQESEQRSHLVALAHAPVVRMGQWGGHTHCLLANALFKARDQLPGDLRRLVESRWEAELEALAELLATEVPDAERYLARLEASGCFHAGPFYSGQLLARLGVEEASETFVAFARRQLELAGGAGIRCVASFTLEARGEQSEVFTTTSSGAGVEASLPIVAAPLRHDRSGHAECLGGFGAVRRFSRGEGCPVVCVV